jgi:hypothetical protein
MISDFELNVCLREFVKTRSISTAKLNISSSDLLTEMINKHYICRRNGNWQLTNIGQEKFNSL